MNKQLFVGWKRKVIIATSCTVTAIIAGWCVCLLLYPLTQDRLEVADEFKKVCASLHKKDFKEFYTLVLPSYRHANDDGNMGPGLGYRNISPDINPRWDIYFKDGKAYVKSMESFGDWKGKITLEFQKHDGHWLFTGKYIARLPGTSPTLKSAWRKMISWWR